LPCLRRRVLFLFVVIIELLLWFGVCGVWVFGFVFFFFGGGGGGLWVYCSFTWCGGHMP